MSPTIVMPGDHCAIPSNSGRLNCALMPPPARSAHRTSLTAVFHCQPRDREVSSGELIERLLTFASASVPQSGSCFCPIALSQGCQHFFKVCRFYVLAVALTEKTEHGIMSFI